MLQSQLNFRKSVVGTTSATTMIVIVTMITIKNANMANTKDIDTNGYRKRTYH